MSEHGPVVPDAPHFSFSQPTCGTSPRTSMHFCRNLPPKFCRCIASHLRLSVSSRRFHQSARGSTSKPSQPNNPFPYPTHRNPTPHQLFHLPHNATETDIKSRCMCFFLLHFLVLCSRTQTTSLSDFIIQTKLGLPSLRALLRHDSRRFLPPTMP